MTENALKKEMYYYYFVGNSEGFHTNAAQSAYSCIQRCWQNDVLLLPLCHRFWKLTLQILARLTSWVEEVRQIQVSKGP